MLKAEKLIFDCMQRVFQGKTVTLPDFLIVGAAKSGTTSIYYYLLNNPKVFFPKVKEPHFFSFYNNHPSFKSPETLPTTISSMEGYQKLFLGAKDTLVGEASQSYLYMFDEVISNLKEIYGEAYKKIKIVIVLRNPIDRAWSQYWHFRKNFNEDLEFLEAIKPEVIKERMDHNWNVFYDYLGFGHYHKQVKAYLAHFDHVEVLLYDDLKSDSNAFMTGLSNFLGLDHQEYTDNKIYNVSGEPKKNLFGYLWKVNSKNKMLKPLKAVLPYRFRKKLSNAILEKSLERQIMPMEVRDILAEYYKDEIVKLSKLLNDEKVLRWNHKYQVDAN